MHHFKIPRTIILAVLAIVFLVVVFYQLFNKNPDNSFEPGQSGSISKEINLGAIFALSGDSAVLGESEQKAVELALAEINSVGGINGRKINIIWEDGKCSGQDAVLAANKLISLDKVNVILAGGCSSEVLGFASLTEKNNVLVPAITASSPEISQIGEYIFRNVPSDAFSATKLAQYAAQNNYKRVAIISEQTDYSQALRNKFKEAIGQLQGEIVANETFQSTDRDVRNQIVKLKKSQPDVIFLAAQTLSTAIIVARQINELELKSPLLTTEIILVGDNSELENAKKYFEGAVISRGDFSAVDQGHLDQFNKNYLDRFGEPCAIGEYYCGYGYEMMYLLKDGLVKCEEDTGCLKEYFHSINEVDLIMGPLTIDQYGDAVRSYTINRIVDGKSIPL